MAQLCKHFFKKLLCMIYMVCYISTLHPLHLSDKMVHSFMQISMVVNRVRVETSLLGYIKKCFFLNQSSQSRNIPDTFP